MIISLGFDEITDSILLVGDDLTRVNLSVFISHPSNNDILFRNYLVNNLIANDSQFLISQQIINEDITISLNRGHILTNHQVDRIHDLIKIFTIFCIKEKKITTENAPQSLYATLRSKAVHSQWDKSLYVRYGNVELRVIENFLRRPTELFNTLEEIKVNIDSDAYMYREPIARKNWLSASDVNFCLRKLITNAGFYPAIEGDDDSLENWCYLYLNAIESSEYIFPSSASPNFWFTQSYLILKGKEISYQAFPYINDFYLSIANQKVLFVTPFADEINGLYETGNLFRLYKDIPMPYFEMMAVRADISTFPNRPHRSWNESFNALKLRVDSAFKVFKPSIFFASCGCYGLPICNYVFKHYGITSVYYGNYLNTLFGVRQKCSEELFPERRNLAMWASSNLNQFKNMSLIDNGRYV